ncbi:hypothetical protein Q75_13650, partial [Bacillus coahuilensis p1.1.43]
MDSDCDGGAGIVVAGRREIGRARCRKRGAEGRRAPRAVSAVHKEEKRREKSAARGSAVQKEGSGREKSAARGERGAQRGAKKGEERRAGGARCTKGRK